MDRIFTVAINTFKEIIRDRILYGLLLFSVFIIGLSRAMGGLSFAEQERIVIDFGLAGVHLSIVILSVFVGSTLVAKELEKRTILTLLTRPITRAEYILGKYLGFVFVIFLLATLLFLVLFLVLALMNVHFNFSMLLALHGFLLEALVLVSVTMAFGIYSKPILSVSFVMGIFIIGHWIESLNYFASGSDSVLFKSVGSVISFVMPNLEMWNWKSQAVNRQLVSSSEFLSANLNALSWSGLFICIAVVLFKRKDCA